VRAVLTTAHGDRSTLEFRRHHPLPALGTGEVLVQVRSTALNFHDVFTRRGMPGIRISFPVIVGSDIAGVVVEASAATESAHTGKRVLVDPVFRKGRIGMIGETVDGGRAEYVAVPADQLIEIPDGVTFEEAAALPLAYGTAWRMIVTHGDIQAGERVLVLGASGGVGVACVQLAKLAGAEVIACASRATKLRALQCIGADYVLNYSETPFVNGVTEVYGKPRLDGSGGVDVAINFTGGDTLRDTQRCVRLGGRILTCGATAGFELQLDARYWWSYEHRMLGSNGWKPDDLRSLLTLIAAGRLKPVIDEVLPLEHAAEAERRLEDREVFGKLLLAP
jgi:alcohol dehydrogenase